MPGFDITPPDPLGTQQDWRQTLARTAVLEGQAAQTKQAQADDAAFRQAVSGVDPTLTRINRIDAIAEAAMKTGKYSTAEHLLGLASTMENRDSMRDQRAARAAEFKARTELDQIKTVAEVYSGVKDEIGWQMAHDYFKELTGKESPMAKLPYSKQVLDLATSSMAKKMSEYQAASLAAREKHEKNLVARQAAVQALRERLAGKRIEVMDANIARTEKAGGKFSIASKREEELVSDVIRDAFPDLEDKSRGPLSREVANIAKSQKLAGEEGTLQEIARQVLAENPDLVQSSRSLFGVGPMKTTRTPRALPLPSDSGKLKSGAVYTKGGKSYRFKGGDPSTKAAWEEVQ